jgi:hypothetical protein
MLPAHVDQVPPYSPSCSCNETIKKERHTNVVIECYQEMARVKEGALTVRHK